MYWLLAFGAPDIQNRAACNKSTVDRAVVDRATCEWECAEIREALLTVPNINGFGVIIISLDSLLRMNGERACLRRSCPLSVYIA